jgi:hypothetical protein
MATYQNIQLHRKQAVSSELDPGTLVNTKTRTHEYSTQDNREPYPSSLVDRWRKHRSSRTVSGAFRIAVLSVRDFFVATTKSIAIPAWAYSRRRWCTTAKQKACCSNVKLCSMLLINFIRSASYEALPNHPASQ